MSDLIQALNLCLQFTPDVPTPGLNGVFFDFSTEGTVNLFATDGHMMIRITLVAMVTTPTPEPYYLPEAEVMKLTNRFQKSTDPISISAWGDDVMFMAGSEVVTAHRAEDEYEGKYREFFDPQAPQDFVQIDFHRLQKAIVTGMALMASYKGCGPVFSARIHANKTKGTGNMMIVSPMITPGMDNLESVKIVIMGAAV